MWDMQPNCGEGAYQVACKWPAPVTKHKAQILNPAEKMWFPARTAARANQTLCHHVCSPRVVQVSKYLLLPGQHRHLAGQALPGVRLLHNASETTSSSGLPFSHAKWSCDGIPRELSHCHSLDISLSHTSFGLLKEVELRPHRKVCRSSRIERERRRINFGCISFIC